LPAVSEGKGDLLGRPAGAALWESQFPLHVLESIRIAVGPQVWSALYQGNPTAAQGMIFKRSWFRHYQSVPEKFSKIVQSWDTAFKTGATNDYSVCTTWGQTDTGYYLLHFWRDRVEFPELKRQVAEQAAQWKPHAIIIEDKASGQSLLQELKTATPFPVLPVKVDADKQTRASAVTAYFEAGKVLFPEGASWLADLEDELAGFPNAVHDDIVDSITQALNHFRENLGELGFIGYIKGLVSGIFSLPDESKPSSPRDELVGQKANFQLEMKVRGVHDPAAPVPPRVPQTCPQCKSKRTVPMPGNAEKCDDCSHQFWPDDARRPMQMKRQTRGEYLAEKFWR
jgi:predicted phage terminase large subunit-like protein